MREIKFRVWQPIIKSITKIESFDCARQPAYWFKILMDIQKMEDDNYVPVTTNSINRKDVPDFVLMQYTGLKDKNGKEIYEGDIVHIAYMVDINAQTHIYGEIIFKEGGFFSTDKDKHGDLHRIIPNRSEIIGNIYENPELLKEKA